MKLVSKQLAAYAGLTMMTGLVTTGAAFADGHEKVETPKVYLSAFGGVIFEGEADTSGVITPPGGPQTVFASYDTGFLFGAAVGAELTEFGNDSITPRVEVEVSFSRADVDRVLFSGNGPAAEVNVSGETSTTLILANAFLDFNTDLGFTPFIGGGLGVGIVDFDFAYGPGINLRDSDTGFAIQLIAGASFDVTDNIKWTVDGRYSRVFDVSSVRRNGAGASTGTVTGDVDNFAITTGLRYSF